MEYEFQNKIIKASISYDYSDKKYVHIVICDTSYNAQVKLNYYQNMWVALVDAQRLITSGIGVNTSKADSYILI